MKNRMIFLVLLVVLFNQCFVVNASDDRPFYIHTCSVDPNILFEMINLKLPEEGHTLTRFDCIKLIVESQYNKKDQYSEDKLNSIIEKSWKFKFEDWNEMTLEEKNIVFFARDFWIFFGEEHDGKLYANLDEPLTYYQALIFLMRWYYDNCYALCESPTRYDWDGMHTNWLDYAEMIGILYGRIPNEIVPINATTLNITEAFKLSIEQKKNEPISLDDFKDFLCNTLLAPTYDVEYRRLQQSSILNKVFLLKIRY